MFGLKGLSNTALKEASVPVLLCCCPGKFYNGVRTYEELLGYRKSS